jgi:hypothetical protein
MISKEDFSLLKKNMRERYDSLRTPTYCKCLNQKVHLNARGFHHLLYDGSGKARPMIQARARLVLVPLIPSVLKLADDCSYEKRYVRENRKKDSPSVRVEMWGMEATVGKNASRVKVVVRREDGGKLIFWSIMRIR